MAPSHHHTRKPCESTRETCRDELDHALERLRGGADPAEVVEKLSQRLTNRLLHLPTKLIADA